jgi:hypothetical protein
LLGVNLVGRKILRYEFIGSDTNSEVTSRTLMSTLNIQDSTWNDAQWKIQVMNATYTQNAFMGTIINNDPDSGNYKDATDDLNGKMIPLTFGAFKVIDGNPVCAKFIKTANSQNSQSNDTLIPGITPAGQSIFPVVAAGTAPTLQYTIQLGLAGGGYTTPPSAGMCLKVVEGGSSDGTSLVGKCKIITDWTYFQATKTLIIEIDSYFEKDLTGNSTATATPGQAWVSIIDLKHGFSGDTWKLKGFFDNAGSLLSSGIRLYSYIDKDIQKSFERTIIYDAAQNEIGYSKLKKVGFRPVALYGYSVLNNGFNNALIINALLIDDDPDKLYSFDIFPLKNFSKYVASDLTVYGVPGGVVQCGSGTNFYSGSNLDSLITYIVTTNPATTPNMMIDRNDATYEQHSAAFHSFWLSAPDTDLGTIWLAFEAEIDFEKILIDYDNYYLGLNIELYTGLGARGSGLSRNKIQTRRFLGTSKDILSPAIANKIDDNNQHGFLNNLPDFYYADGGRSVPDNNAAFYREQDTAPSSMALVTGFKTYPLSGVDSLDKLKSIYKIGLLIGTNLPDNPYPTEYLTARFKELAIICQSTDNISSEIFTLCSGRIFNDTWGARKTAANQMVTPADIVEHCKRLGNWGTPTVTPGLEYDPAALIKTGSAEGSFDMISMMPSTITTYPGFYNPTFQVDNDSEAWTAEIEKKLCAAYNLCTYYDPDGTACIKSLLKENPSETINFEDLAGDCSDVQCAQVQDVFCQPILNYQYNYGSSKYDKQMAITNIQASTYSASYTPGFKTGDGEARWNACKVFYNRYKQIEVPPSDWTDQKTVSTYDEALALFDLKIAWMGRDRITVPVFYDKGKTYHYAQHINLCLPHQTNGILVECVIEKVIKDKNFKPAGKVEVSLIMLDELNPVFSYDAFQDHYDGEGTTPLVEQDHYDGEGSTPGVKQDNYQE